MTNIELNKILDLADKNQKQVHDLLLEQKKILDAFPNFNTPTLKIIYSKYRIFENKAESNR